MKSFLRQAFTSTRLITILTIIACIICSVQSRYLGDVFFGNTGYAYTHYNNYVIFKNSFLHLVNNQDLYQLYLRDQWDLYKYSPTFALFFGLFAYLPDLAGLLLWNLVNTLVLVYCIKMLPGLSEKKKAFILWYILIELIGSLQSSQSNLLMAGLLVGAFAFAEKRQFTLAILLIICSVYIKIYGLMGFAIFLFYPRKIKNILLSLLFGAIFFFLPLVVISFHQLIFLYKSWGAMVNQDIDTSLGLSVYGWLDAWFHWLAPRGWVLGTGIILYLLPLARVGSYKNLSYRYSILALTLLWMIVFNPKSESPTFIIAAVGVALWYWSNKVSTLDTVLLGIVFVFTILSATDIFPRYIRDHFFIPYVIKVVPCIAVFLLPRMFSQPVPEPIPEPIKQG
jgi:hypothetical protein